MYSNTEKLSGFSPDTSELLNSGEYYWVNGQKIYLLERKDQFAVILPEGSNSLRNIRGLNIVEQLDNNKYIIEIPATTDTNTDRLIAQLESQRGIENVLPVYQTSLSDSWLVANNEIIVSLKNGVSAENFFDRDSRIISYRPLLGTRDQYVVTVRDADGVIDIANQLQADSRTKWAAPNFYQEYQPYSIPNDPLFNNQWHLNNTGQFGGTPNADVDAPEAWNISEGGSSDVVIAVIDDGMQLNHPDLNYYTNPGEIADNGIDDDGNGWVDDVNGWDFTSAGEGDNNPGPTVAVDRHATAVAGVAAAKGNNNLGVTGIAYQSRVLPVRIFEGGVATTDDRIASAIYYAAGRTADGTGTWQAADIINNSWGGGLPSAAITEAITWASNSGRNGKGVISFIAAGNDYGSPVSFPANLSDDLAGVIAVGASDNLNNRASYSNVGPELDVVAPSNGRSAAIVTTDRTGRDGYVFNNYTNPDRGFGGTSSATPLTAGIGALILARDPSLTAAQVKRLLRNTTDLIGWGYNSNGFSEQFGYGKVNAYTALSGVGTREIQVLDKTVNITDDTGVVNLTTRVGGEVIKTFRVRNQGTEDLNLGNINLGNGPFTLVNDFTDTTLSVGESARFTVKFNPATSGTFRSEISFTNNDSDEGNFNFTLSGTTTNPNVFSNSNAIAINDGSPASPYPSNIVVSGLGGLVNSVKVTLNKLSHSWPDDVDILLVGPSGQKALLMSDVGGESDLNQVTLTFDDAAQNPLPDNSEIVSGTYSPTNSGLGDNFRSPAPSAPL